MNEYKGLSETQLNKMLVEVVAKREAVPTRGSRTDPKVIEYKAMLKKEQSEIQDALMDVA